MDRLSTLEKASMYIMEDLVYLSKMRSGRRKVKFFSTTFIEGLVYDAIDDVLREHGKKFTKKNRAAYVTSDVLNQLHENIQSDLIVEHIVCKNIYFGEIKQLLFKNELSHHKVYEILSQYYVTALITKKEDRLLDNAGLRTKMVTEGEWNKKDIFIRYNSTLIKLQRNPFYIFNN